MAFDAEVKARSLDTNQTDKFAWYPTIAPLMDIDFSSEAECKPIAIGERQWGVNDCRYARMGKSVGEMSRHVNRLIHDSFKQTAMKTGTCPDFIASSTKVRLRTLPILEIFSAL